MKTKQERRFVCGTRAVIGTKAIGYRVVCATCGAGGTVFFPTRQAAIHACVWNSTRKCKSCGAS